MATWQMFVTKIRNYFNYRILKGQGRSLNYLFINSIASRSNVKHVHLDIKFTIRIKSCKIFYGFCTHIHKFIQK